MIQRTRTYCQVALMSLLLLCTACAGNSRLDVRSAKKNAVLEIEQVQMTAENCFGSCPVFKMTIRADKHATYEAIAFNKKQGSFQATLRARDYNKFISLLQQTGFEQLSDSFAVPATDMPAFRLTIVYNKGKVKNIYDYGLKGSKALEDFYGFVYGLTDTQEWK